MNSDFSKGSVFTRIKEFLKDLKMQYNTEFRVVLYTSIGKIICDLELPAKKNSLLRFTDDPSNFTIDLSAIFDGQDVFDIHLVNAKNVIVYNNKEEEIMRADQMILFCDQILGFALIKK
jgi:hypothetical protein